MLSPKEEQSHLRQGKPSFATFNFESSETSSVTSDTPFGLSSPQSLDDKNNRALNGDPLAKVPLAKSTANGGDNYSVTSSINSSKYDDSLIFERLVQDPLIDGQPIPNSMPRHVASHNFIPSSLDTTTHIVNNPETTLADIDGEEIKYGFHSRRSSLANLEAAFSAPSNSNFRKSSNTNLQSGFYKRGSYSQASLSRTSSNLTQQLQQDASAPAKLSKTTSIPSLKLLSTNNNNNNNNNDLLPPLTTTRSASSGTFFGGPRSAGLSSSASPTSNIKNKCFCSYADLIAQDDNEMKSPIRRPSISASLSNSFSIARTNSATKARSPSVSLSQSLRGQSSFGRYSNKNTNSNNNNEEAVDSSSVFSTSIENNNNNNSNNYSSPLSRTAQDSRVSYSSRVNASLNNPQSMENFIN